MELLARCEARAGSAGALVLGRSAGHESQPGSVGAAAWLRRLRGMSPTLACEPNMLCSGLLGGARKGAWRGRAGMAESQWPNDPAAEQHLQLEAWCKRRLTG
jgi:hypothetical protein